MRVYDDSIKRFDCSSRDDCPLIENVLDWGRRREQGNGTSSKGTQRRRENVRTFCPHMATPSF